jgi:Arc/MetJ-type ribon-helix-helix transcriptional regulator
MPEHRVILKLNQQQLELVDNTVAKGEASSRADLVRRALTEFAARHLKAEPGAKGRARQ